MTGYATYKFLLLHNIATVTLPFQLKMNDTEKTTNCRLNVYRMTEVSLSKEMSKTNLTLLSL